MTDLNEPLVFEIKGNSLDDGPGIRSVIFLKGCPLSCVWCHNPEGRRIDAEISFDAGMCAACDACIDVCPENALSRDNPFFVDRSVCILCFECEKVCPSGALTRVGRRMSVDEIVEHVIRDKPFFDNSGGGVTLSGGEPAMFPEFSGRLLREFKKRSIHTLLETSGVFDSDRFDRVLYPWLDTIYFDIKIMDPEEHIRYCGVSNETILANFKELFGLSKNSGAAVIPRIPLIPGITDTHVNIRACADFLAGCGAREVRLLPYHPLWREKNPRLGISTELESCLNDWPSRRVSDGIKGVFKTAGISPEC